MEKIHDPESRAWISPKIEIQPYFGHLSQRVAELKPVKDTRDVTSKACIKTFQDHNAGVNSVKFHPDGTCVASGSSDNAIKIWDIRSQRLIQHYDGATDSVNEIAFHPNGRYLLSAASDATVKIWDLR